MAKTNKRNVFSELMDGVHAMQAHREGRITLRSHRIPVLALPRVSERVIRTTRERLHMSRAAFAHRLGVNPNARAVGARTQQAERSGRSVNSASSQIPGYASSARDVGRSRIAVRNCEYLTIEVDQRHRPRPIDMSCPSRAGSCPRWACCNSTFTLMGVLHQRCGSLSRDTNAARLIAVTPSSLLSPRR